MRKIILAIDSFKGCVSSGAISDHLCEVCSLLVDDVNFVIVPISDGGEGMSRALKSDDDLIVSANVCDPLFRPISAHYVIKNNDTAIIEMVIAGGLTLLSADELNPLKTTTYGVGELINNALDRGIRKFIIGIGGSATNDAGMGMLQALGWKFFDEDDIELSGIGVSLEKVVRVDDSSTNVLLSDAIFEVACDVDNPFCGVNGAAYVYAPQKGASNEVVLQLDEGLKRFAKVIEKYNGKIVENLAGAGAAGGLGGALYAFLGAQLKSGIDVVLDFNKFDTLLEDAELVITGEGAIDKQTLMGKAPYGVLKRAKRSGVSIIAISGRVDNKAELIDAGFDEVFEISPRELPIQEAVKLEVTFENVTRIVNTGEFKKYIFPKKVLHN